MSFREGGAVLHSVGPAKVPMAPVVWGVIIGAGQAASRLAVHGLKDLWQHRTQFVRNTRWWPPFCATVDFVAATILVVLIVTGADFHG